MSGAHSADKRCAISVSAPTYRRLRKAAKARGVPMAVIVAQALADLFTRQDEGRKQAEEAEDLLGDNQVTS